MSSKRAIIHQKVRAALPQGQTSLIRKLYIAVNTNNHSKMNFLYPDPDPVSASGSGSKKKSAETAQKLLLEENLKIMTKNRQK